MKKALTLMLAVCICLLLAAPASAAADSSPFAGDWKFYAQEGDAPMSHEEILAMAAMGLDMTSGLITSFRGDGTMTMNVFGERVDGTWTDSGDGSGFFTVEGETYPMSVRDGFLRMDMVTAIGVFEPSDMSAENSTAGFPPLLEELRDEGRDYAGKYTLTFMDDGWFKFCNFYGFEQNNWTDGKDGAVTVYADGKSWDCTIEDGLLVLRSGDNVMRYERTVPIGTTGYYVAVPADYVPGEVTEEDRRDDMVAYYRSDKHLMDFDIYQFAKDGRILEEYAEKEAKEFGADWIDTVVFNGVPLVFYISQEQYDGAEYRVANFLFDAGNDFGEIVFWLDGPNDGEEAAELTEQILSSIFYRKPDPEDVNGMIVMKLEGESFPDRYQVLGEDGEMYEGEYLFGFEDLEPGTAVILSWRNGKWSIEREDPWAAFG